jgi:hypothetical protein
MLTSILEALIAIPKIASIVEQLCAGISAWWLSRQQAQTYQAIIDAAALSARAQNHDDRIKALEAWRAALSRNRDL